MSKKNIILFASVAMWNILFYNTSVGGLNLLLFALVVLSGCVIYKPRVLRYWQWWTVSVAFVTTAVFGLLHFNAFTMCMYLISGAIAVGYSAYPRSSVLSALFHSTSTAVAGIVLGLMHQSIQKQRQQRWMLQKQVLEHNSNEPKDSSNKKIKIALIFIPIIILFFFFLLYRNASPLFKEFTGHIFNFLSFKWIFHTLLGMYVLYVLYNIRMLRSLLRSDTRASQPIVKEKLQAHSLSFWGKMFSLDTEYQIGIISFISLNVLLFLVNFLDIQFLALDGDLPSKLAWSEYVHQGVGTVIFTIVASILLIVFFFRSFHNFGNNKLLKILAYVWLAQNAVLVLITMQKNGLYVQEVGLTYKRIGVFFYLSFCIIGLISTAIKIQFKKQVHYLFHINALLILVLLSAATSVNWSNLITKHNLSHKNTDFEYLTELNPSNLPLLINYIEVHPEMSTLKLTENGDLGNNTYQRAMEFMDEMSLQDKRAWSADEHAVYLYLLQKNQNDSLKKLIHWAR